MKTLFSKLSLCLASILLSLLMAEGAMRYFRLVPAIFDYKIFEPMQFVENAKICYKMKPLGDCEGGRLNADGFKDSEFVLKKGKDVFRIVMLGDSITKGTGVSLGRTFSDELERLLNEKAREDGTELRYEVMNFGVGGYNIVSEMEVLKVHALRYHPDIVILNYFHNDNEEYSFNYWFFMDKEGISSAEKNLVYNYYLSSNKFNLNRMLFHSRLYLFCWMRVGSLFKKLEDIDVRRENYKEDIVFEKIKELKGLGAQHHFKVFIAMHPVLDYDKVKPHRNYELTEKIAQSLSIPYLDLRLVYQKASKDPSVFLQNPSDNIHPNVQGHKAVARALCEALEEYGLKT